MLGRSLCPARPLSGIGPSTLPPKCSTFLRQSPLLSPRSGSYRIPFTANLCRNPSQARGAKTSSRSSLADLPQGLVIGSADEPAAPKRATRARRSKKTTSADPEPEPGASGSDPGSSPLPSLEPDSALFPTVIQQAKENMERNPNCVLLTRVGNFYEFYFDQAEQYSALLDIKLARKKTSAGMVSMAGFPYFQLERYLRVLVQDLNKFVAIAEEYSINTPAGRAKSGGLMFDRRISRIITPGTLIDESFMNPWEHNFILSVHNSSPLEAPTGDDADSPSLGISWLDLSSGSFYVQSLSPSSIASAIERIGPREIVVRTDLHDQPSLPEWLSALIEEKSGIISFHRPSDEPVPSLEEWDTLVDFTPRPLQLKAAKGEAEFTPVELESAYFLLQYVRTRVIENPPKLQRPQQRSSNEIMYIDKATLRALEIKSTIRDGAFKGSLLHSVRRTVTKSGTRLLSQRLLAPSMDLDEINRRLNLVTEMVECSSMREQVVGLLEQTADLPRLLQKFAFGRGSADNLLELAKTIQMTKHIADVLRNHLSSRKDEDGTAQICSQLEGLIAPLEPEKAGLLAARIFQTIDEERLQQKNLAESIEAAGSLDLAESILGELQPGSTSEEAPKMRNAPRALRSKEVQVARFVAGQHPAITPTNSATDIWIMRRNATPTLQHLHDQLDRLYVEKEALEISLRSQLSAPTLTLKWSAGLGYICHLRNKDTSRVNPELFPDILRGSQTISSSKSTRSITLPAWAALGASMDATKMRIRSTEQDIFRDLRADVLANLAGLQANSDALDELDISAGFARLAIERNLVRPELDADSATHHIADGRHMTVELGLSMRGKQFTSNDCLVGGQPDSPAEPAMPDVPAAAPAPSVPQILLITGPNMAGKSTFLRQSAIISILAQSGSFVPAGRARVGLVDKLFARVGSADNVFANQSTFMVEMLETAAILKQATPRSFVVMDEVGRGTTPAAGTAIAFATLAHLARESRCRTLFATHFTALAGLLAGSEVGGLVKCFCTDVVESADRGSWAFVHKLREGVSKGSHALKVAKMAGIPDSTVERAGELLKKLNMSHPAGS